MGFEYNTGDRFAALTIIDAAVQSLSEQTKVSGDNYDLEWRPTIQEPPADSDAEEQGVWAEGQHRQVF
jgi:hypothetical protein